LDLLKGKRSLGEGWEGGFNAERTEFGGTGAEKTGTVNFAGM